VKSEKENRKGNRCNKCNLGKILMGIINIEQTLAFWQYTTLVV
jgi:hypothetical protein